MIDLNGKKVLVTGASGRVGKEVVAGLSKRFENATIVAATRDPSVRFSIRRRRFYVFFSSCSIEL